MKNRTGTGKINYHLIIKRDIIIIAMAILFSCGYRLIGKGGALPVTIKNLAIMPFDNQTNIPELPERIKEAITSEMARRTSIKIGHDPDEAEAILKGTLLSYGLFPVTFDTKGRANRFQIVIAVTAEIKEKGTDKVLYKSQIFKFQEIYERGEGAEAYFSEKRVAYDTISKDFARAFVSNFLEGF